MKKEQVIDSIKELPEEFDLDLLLEKLLFIEKVEKGLRQVKKGEVVSHEEVKKWWINGENNWTELAKDDLQEIYDYVSQDSELYALRLIDKIVERTEILAEHPLTGRIVPEFDDKTIREVIEGNYRIVYYLDKEEQVNIIRVITERDF